MIGIQLPDGLKRKAIEICEKFGDDVILSGESCYGACDIDLELLKDVEILYHFAHTQILNLEKVFYVPYTIEFDVQKVCDRIGEIKEKNLALISTAQYCHELPKLKKMLEEKGFKVYLKAGKRAKLLGQVLGCDYSALKDSDAEAVVFVGDGVFHAKGAAIYTKKKVYAVNPFSLELIEVSAEEFEKERYKLLARCYGKNVGIIVSTKPGQKRLNLALEIKRKALKRGYKAIIIYFNEVTPEKIENFPFDFYVNTACPRISYDDFKRFKKPIITPEEFYFLLGINDSIELDSMA